MKHRHNLKEAMMSTRLTTLALLLLALATGPVAAEEWPGQQHPSLMIDAVEGAASVKADADNDGLIAYAFFDPTCPACQELHRLVMEEEATPGIDWRWIPIGTNGRDAQIQAAQILQLHGIDPEQGLRTNIKAAGRVDLRRVPTIFYRQPGTRKLMGFEGADPAKLKALQHMAETQEPAN